MSTSIDVVGAVITSGGVVFCAKRGPGRLVGKWEFPGGKVELGENPRQALEREIAEELDCGITVGKEVTTTRHEYEFASITLTTFWCTLDRGTPLLREHAEVAWLTADELGSRDWAPADLPAVDLVSAALSKPVVT